MALEAPVIALIFQIIVLPPKGYLKNVADALLQQNNLSENAEHVILCIAVGAVSIAAIVPTITSSLMALAAIHASDPEGVVHLGLSAIPLIVVTGIVASICLSKDLYELEDETVVFSLFGREFTLDVTWARLIDFLMMGVNVVLILLVSSWYRWGPPKEEATPHHPSHAVASPASPEVKENRKPTEPENPETRSPTELPAGATQSPKSEEKKAAPPSIAPPPIGNEGR